MGEAVFNYASEYDFSTKLCTSPRVPPFAKGGQGGFCSSLTPRYLFQSVIVKLKVLRSKSRCAAAA
ncbi:hypothetical protein LPW11_00470 [Geomonas sp. RF6]|uniref:hypothetical protein n=1 Tax=Geomonas sp. RF6 TaxID=2897342 RepID=UPI001E636201|nr:hypothetical protein [Geomonas sp. RF6]UFS70679.1 hypothetical protein LPW11_00470 [Geomonas sp. RF6]